MRYVRNCTELIRYLLRQDCRKATRGNANEMLVTPIGAVGGDADDDDDDDDGTGESGSGVRSGLGSLSTDSSLVETRVARLEKVVCTLSCDLRKLSRKSDQQHERLMDQLSKMHAANRNGVVSSTESKGVPLGSG